MTAKATARSNTFFSSTVFSSTVFSRTGSFKHWFFQALFFKILIRNEPLLQVSAKCFHPAAGRGR
jgi:hypothetical protein